MAYDRTAPATSAALASSPVRANFQALDHALYSNLVRDPYFTIWPTTTTLGHWAVAAGTPSRDTGIFKAKGMSAKITGSASGRYRQSILNSTDFDTVFRSRDISWGCWVYSDTAAVARVGIDDGISPVYSSYHAGGSAWTWLTGTMTLDAAATEVLLYLDSFSATALTYFDLPTVVWGPVPPQDFIPGRNLRGALGFAQKGNAAAATAQWRFRLGRPWLALSTQLYCKTAPASQALIIDVNQDISGTPTSMYSTRPQIAAAATAGGADPDTTYNTRCFNGSSTNGAASLAQCTIDIDQVGSGTVGDELNVRLSILQYSDDLELFRAVTSHGNE